LISCPLRTTRAGRRWSQAAFTFDGRLHRTEGASLEPKPARPIPIWLGTFGDRALAVTGRLADGWIPSYGDRPLEQYRAMRERVLTAARDSGRDPGAITCALHLQVHVGDDATADPAVVAGPPGTVTERLLAFAGIGFTAFSFAPIGSGASEQAERLACEVIPVLRDALMGR
jgi:alkanesulfonate monooxygenase SsuD/methylene tetrahydromethanopterin reductase-like flavin-dependent oxidoreductase (luciferase family)